MMLATLFIGVGTASAATDNVAMTVPNIGTSTSGTDTAVLGTLKITETDAGAGSIVKGQQITINLPTGVEYNTPVSTSATGDTLNAYVTSNNYDLTVKSASNKSMTVIVGDKSGSYSSANKTYLKFYFGGNTDTALTTHPEYSAVTLDGPDADVAVTVYAPNSGITEGKVIVAKSSSSGTTATVLDDSTISNSKGTQLVGTLRIAENRANSIVAGDTIKIVAPDDVDFADPIMSGTGTGAYATSTVKYGSDSDATKNVKSYFSGTWGETQFDKMNTPITLKNGKTATATFGIKSNSDNRSEMDITVIPTASGETPGFVDVYLYVNVNDSDLTGPLTFKVKGDDVTNQDVTIGTIGDYKISVTAKGDPKTVKAGATDQEIQDMTIKELLKGSFLTNRSVIVELPDYAHWYENPSLSLEKGTSMLTEGDENPKTDDNQRHKVTFNVNSSASTTKTEYTLKDMKVFLDADAPAGDLTVKVSGDGVGGEDYSVVLAKVVKPVAVSATPTDVKLGVTAQPAGDLTITEAAAGMLKYKVTELGNDWSKTTLDINGDANNSSTSTDQTKTANLIVGLPDGVTFDSTPTVTVTTGDLKVKEGSVKLTNDDQYLQIPIDKTSTVASTIKVTGIKLTVNRTVPEGAINAKLFGNAVDQTEDSDKNCYDAVDKAAIATAVTPADQTASYTSSFVIGASTYTVNGQTVNAVAPSYIKNSRTYLAIRDVAHALGIVDSNVLWDGTKHTVTLIKGDKVVQMTVGSTTLTVNGAAVTMDVAPEITASRTFLPAAWLAQAFGSTATFDAATQTVTIK
jgi:hypothetical protein